MENLEFQGLGQKVDELLSLLSTTPENFTRLEKKLLKRVNNRISKEKDVNEQDQQALETLHQKFHRPSKMRAYWPVIAGVGLAVVGAVVGIVQKSQSKDQNVTMSPTASGNTPDNCIETSELLECGPFRYQVKGTASERMKIVQQMPEVLSLFQKLDLDDERLVPKKPFLITCDRQLKLRGCVIPGDMKQDYSVFLSDSAIPVNVDPFLIQDGSYQIHINPEKAQHQLSGVIAHEIFHLFTGYMPQTSWMEGMAEAFEVINGSRKAPDAKDYYIEDGSYATVEQLELMALKHGLDQLPWKMQGMYDALFSEKINKPYLAYMRRNMGASYWMKLFQEHPHFLKSFLLKLRESVGTPQNKLLQEKELIAIASSIVPNFEQQYSAFPPFQNPQEGQVVFSYLRQGNSLEVNSGRWESHKTRLTGTGIDLKVFMYRPQPFWIRIDGSEIKSLNNPNIPGQKSVMIGMTFDSTQKVEISQSDPAMGSVNWELVR